MDQIVFPHMSTLLISCLNSSSGSLCYIHLEASSTCGTLNHLCKKIQITDFKWDMDFLRLWPDQVLMGLVIAHCGLRLEKYKPCRANFAKFRIIGRTDEMLNLEGRRCEVKIEKLGTFGYQDVQKDPETSNVHCDSDVQRDSTKPISFHDASTSTWNIPLAAPHDHLHKNVLHPEIWNSQHCTFVKCKRIFFFW